MSDMPKLIVLRTQPEHLRAVVQHHKHALNGKLAAQPGDILLICKTGSGLVCHAMRFQRQRHDTAGETEKHWGKHWKYIIDANDCCELNRPFDPKDERITEVSRKDYGPGGSFFYVLKEDAEEFRKKGLLRPLLPPSDLG